MRLVIGTPSLISIRGGGSTIRAPITNRGIAAETNNRLISQQLHDYIFVECYV